jgi:hypothetical protein
MEPGAPQCSCGARIVGDPLGETQFNVRRYGPVFTAVAATAAVAAAALIFTSWLALAAVLPIMLSRRALRLAKGDPTLYGGYKTAAASLAVTLLAGTALASYAIIRIPDYLERRKLKEVAAKQAIMLHIAVLLEQYRAQKGSYPRDLEEIKAGMGDWTLPADFWTRAVKYRAYTEQVASTSFRRGVDAPIGVVSNDFELTLAGPDEEFGTEDDIFMRDGIFYPNPDPPKPLPAKEPALRSTQLPN